MKYYREICIYCGKQQTATQIDQLPIPNTPGLITMGSFWVPRFMRCLTGHTFVNMQNYCDFQVTVDGKTVIPKLRWL